MTIEFVLWLASLLLQAGLLGLIMYTLICLADLENDFTNPHDASARINKWVIPELVIQTILTIVLFMGGKLLVAVIPLLLSLWCLKNFFHGQPYVDVTEIFRQCTKEKHKRLLKLILHLFMFIIVIYRLVNTFVIEILSPEGRELAKKLLKDSLAHT